MGRPGWDHRGLPCEPGRCLCQDIALLAQLPVLTPQTGQLLALGAGRAVLSATFIAIVMRAGSLAVACLAVVPDWPALGRNAEGALAAVRAPESRELYRYHLNRLAGMDELVAGGRRN
jgi:hypothetical protein